jgi:hypothetical protein
MRVQLLKELIAHNPLDESCSRRTNGDAASQSPGSGCRSKGDISFIVSS